jgi:GH35 family endo-1,4-beta-xylanase
MKYGFSLSKGQCDWLGVSYKNILTKLKDTNLKVVRLGLYWNEIEKEKDIYDFSEAEEIVNLASSLGYEIILTIGAKAPRWPEFYVPDYLMSEYKNVESIPEEILSPRLLKFLEKSVERFKDESHITTWQVENEPLDASGAHYVSFSSALLQQEIDLVKSLDSREILVTIWGNDMKKRNTLKKVFELKNIDSIGFDIYPKRPFFFRFYKPALTDKDILKMNAEIKGKGMRSLLTELQAEPWEEGFDYKIHPEKVKSISLEQIEKNINEYKDLGFETILLWGIEYCEWAGILDDVVKLIA